MSLPRTNSFSRFAGICLLLAGAPLCAKAQSVNFQAALDKTEQRMATFLDRLSDVKCTEHVLQQKLNDGGHIEYSTSSTYDYLIMLQSNGDDFQLNESRLEENAKPEHGNAKKKNVPLLLTNGFSTLFLVFHPYYRSSFLFASEGTDTVDNQQLLKVHFSHVPGTRSIAALSVRGREYPLELEGTAWLDPQTGLITRMQVGLGNSMQDVGLRSLKAQVDYAPVNLPGAKSAYLFPAVTTVDVQSLRQRWHNVHKFSNYMQFTVEAEQALADKDKIK
jgi:hypothetical protein